MATFNIDTTTNQVIEKFGENARAKTCKSAHLRPWCEDTWVLNYESCSVVVTGPSFNGLGAEAVYALASASPKRLILAGRSESKIQPVIKKVSEIDSTIAVTYVHLELADLSSVRKAAGEIKQAAPDGIDGLLNNAGVMATKTYTKTVDGNELQFQVNHLGHFLLTKLLLPEVTKVRGVVVNVTSRGFMLSDPEWDNVDFDVSPQFSSFTKPTWRRNGVTDNSTQDGKTYHGWVGYGRSKLANVHFSLALAKRAEKLGVASYSVHPGCKQELIPEDFDDADRSEKWFWRRS